MKKKRTSEGRRSSAIVDIRGTVYAGPTFSNAPLPSTLPIPAFSPPMISMELKKQNDLSRHSKDLMNILASRPTHHFEMDLSEIQRGLRSMLKI